MLIPYYIPEHYGLSSSCGSFAHSTIDTNWYDVTNLSLSLKVSGNAPVWCVLIPGSGSASYIEVGVSSGTVANLNLRFLRDATVVGYMRFEDNNPAQSSSYYRDPVTKAQCWDFPTGGTYTYKVQVNTNTANNAHAIENAKLLVKEFN